MASVKASDEKLALETSLSERAERLNDMNTQQEFHTLINEMMYKTSQRRANSTAISHFLLSFFIAPLLTISTSL
jgi:hypothetical protein